VYELETLTERELRRLLGRGVATVVVPFGSIELHGAHLPLGADGLLADAVGRDVATQLEAVLAPTIHYGHAQEHGPVLSLRPATLTELAIDVATSLAEQGFRVVVLVSAHGGNARSLKAAVDRTHDVLDGVVVCAPVGDVGPDPGSYSGEWLTSVLLALAPDLVNLKAADSKLADELRQATAERGEAHLEQFVRPIVQAVREIPR
jgi:creatinine amidohydrolase/Fe(II)-dependent formamide hydrolase-like protein